MCTPSFSRSAHVVVSTLCACYINNNKKEMMGISSKDEAEVEVEVVSRNRKPIPAL